MRLWVLVAWKFDQPCHFCAEWKIQELNPTKVELPSSSIRFAFSKAHFEMISHLSVTMTRLQIEIRHHEIAIIG